MLFEYAVRYLENLTIPILEDEVGREKFKNNFETIKKKFLESMNVEGFFKTILALKDIDEFKSIYDEYGFWAELYNEIDIPKKQKLSLSQITNLTSKEAEKIINDEMAVVVKLEEFAKIINSPDREEKRMILEEVANGNPYKYKACGSSSFIIQAGDQIVKLGADKRKFEVPYHPRIMMPYFRKKYADDSILEVFNYADTESAQISDQALLDIYKELEQAGIRWGDARKANLVVLTKDNDLPDFIKSKEFNLFGFLEDSRFPTNNHKPLKKGDIVICDLDMLYAKEDSEYQVGLLDDIIEIYLNSKKRIKIDEIDR